MKRWPLGWKLTCWSVLIVGMALAISLVGTRTYLERQELEELDTALSREAAHFFEQFHQHGSRLDWITAREIEEVLPTALAPDRFLLIATQQGRVLFRSRNQPPDSFLEFSPGTHNRALGPGAIRLRVIASDGLVFYIGGDLAEVHRLAAKLTQAYLVALPVVLAVVAFGGWWLARKALLPVKVIADAAEAIRPEDLGTRLAEPAQRDEVGRLARAFNLMLERLERGFQQANRFSADASHELRTPLTVLRSTLADLLDDPGLPEAYRDTVSDLQMQTHGLISITNSLLLLAQADAGRLQLKLQDADLAEVLTDCLEDARILADQHEVAITCEPLATSPVRVDPVRIRQILLNLLVNAMKYNEPNGHVHVKLNHDHGLACLRIGNSGPGIPPEAQPNLFERFYRAGQHEDIPGAGLGLSLARELARQHGGEITLISSRPGWTDFELRLPSKAVSFLAASARSESDAHFASAGEKRPFA